MVTHRGRPRRPDNDICPKCGKPGYFNKFTSWNPLYKNDSRRIYYQFIHQNRGLPPCYIRKQKTARPLQLVGEYRRRTKKVMTYVIDKENRSIIQWKETEAVPIIIYSFTHMPETLKHQLKGLRKLRLRNKEIRWILDQKHGDYHYKYNFKQISPNDILTFGESAEKIFQKVNSNKSWLGKIQMFYDKGGLLYEVLEKRKRQESTL
jgi:hypothetical protein